MSFHKLEIIKPILDAVKQEGYVIPTPIQEQAIPVLLSKKDIMGSAQTGTGKTAAFAIPILQNITVSEYGKGIKALILTPTRELAMQIQVSFDTYGSYLPLKTVVIYGGVKQKSQTDQLQKGADILVATPGRLLDLIDQGFIDLSKVEYFVLDEADRMLDMGFIRDVKKVISYVPAKRQTMLFSATLPKTILDLANSILKDPVRVQITPEETTIEAIKQAVYYVKTGDKIKLLLHILKDPAYQSILVFSRTKHFANRIAKALVENHVSAIPIHGNKSQSARIEALYRFKQGQARVLVATDLASRGLDIEELSLVVNYNLPDVPETYIHRIGRTGRANKKGMAISFVCDEEYPLLKDIQKHIKMYIPIERDHPYDVVINEKSIGRAPEKTPSNNPVPLSNPRTKSSQMSYHSSSQAKKRYSQNKKTR